MTLRETLARIIAEAIFSSYQRKYDWDALAAPQRQAMLRAADAVIAWGHRTTERPTR